MTGSRGGTPASSQHSFYGEVDDGSIAVRANGMEFATSDQVTALVQRIENALTGSGVSRHDIRAAQNIVCEMAMNAAIHGKPSEQDLILISVSGTKLKISMLGRANDGDVRRIRRALDRIKEKVNPHDKEQLFRWRDDEVWRRRRTPTRAGGGAALGMMTISALCREYIDFKVHTYSGMNQFMLRATV